MKINHLKMPTVCIVEPSRNHENDVFAQIELLKGKAKIHVTMPQSQLDLDLFRDTRQLYRALPLQLDGRSSRFEKALRLPFSYWRIRKYCAEIQPEVIVFNTIHSRVDLWLITLLFPRKKCFQVIHNYDRYLTPWTRGHLNWFAGNFVLSEEVHNYIQMHHPASSKLHYFLPIFFESFRKTCRAVRPPWKDGSATFNLGVFGSVDQARRNYQGLVESLRRFKASGLPVNFRVHLVGSAPASFVNLLHEFKLADVVSVYGFTSYADMFALVENMDMVLFLLDSQVKGHKLYNQYKVTGTSVMLKAFQKVGASSDEFHTDKSLADVIYFYPGTNLDVLFRQIARGEISKDEICRREALYKQKSFLTFEAQQKRLVAAFQLNASLE